MSNTKISAAIITYNEEANIRRCLESVLWADEIIIVDSFSTDATVEVAREYTDRVIQRDWPGYIEQKNFAVGQAANEWVFAIDADEEVSPALQRSIRELRAKGLMADGYRLARRVHYLGKWINHSGWYPDYKVRLFNRDKGHWGGVNPHDEVILSGAVATLSGDLYHYSYKNIAAHIQQINKFTSIAAHELYSQGRRSSLLSVLGNPAVKFFKVYFLKRGFLEGLTGFFIAVTGSYYVFLKYMKLYELERSNGEHNNNNA